MYTALSILPITFVFLPQNGLRRTTRKEKESIYRLDNKSIKEAKDRGEKKIKWHPKAEVERRLQDGAEANATLDLGWWGKGKEKCYIRIQWYSRWWVVRGSAGRPGSCGKMFGEEGCELGWGEGAHQDVVEAQSQEMVAVVAGVVGGGIASVEGGDEVVHDADHGEGGQQVPQFFEVDNLVFRHIRGHGDEKQVVCVEVQHRVPLGGCVDGAVHGLEQAHQGRLRYVARVRYQQQQAVAPGVLRWSARGLRSGFPDGLEVRLQEIGHLEGMELVVRERLQAGVDLFYNPQALCVRGGELIEIALQCIDVFRQFFERLLADGFTEDGVHFVRVPAVSTRLGRFRFRFQFRFRFLGRGALAGLDQGQTGQVISLEMDVGKLFAMQPLHLLELVLAQLPHERREAW